ncbi:hypothetical protein N7491_010916 [Penicillium cf. griseofulvum]|uniref:Uncharacterized protein n=1 Tax=Penicillium cf. griseofulvum TaxID=2972120 RepID=A0A9W9N0V2_9EURO|nr:hypothetical protein N7472_001235 [Penicillium cf. griseofulvum]KAJ5422471.1 hypothetical protein N7491_010916 [Penicillium cf. griseofulvum]KAJ5428648.1 hypothetical protein N7445_010102 [Penicillium cf. griseofulvum]
MSLSVSTSTTATATRIRTTQLRVQGYPADYDIYHSNVAASNSNFPSQQMETRAITAATQTHNPPGWPNDYRRIPWHRPINQHLDQSQRRVYTSLGEQVFISMMFTGLEINVIANRLWKATGGRLAENLFTYKVGGEF